MTPVADIRDHWIRTSNRVTDRRLFPSWASGNDQPNFFVGLNDGGEGLAGPLGNINDARPFSEGKRWEGRSKSGLVCLIELVERDSIERCNERKEETRWTCCIIANHDGPHIPITDELEHETPKGQMLVITEMRRRG